MDIADHAAGDRVARAVRDQRRALGLRQEDVTAAGGPSKRVLYQLELGTPKGYREDTIERLEQILHWRPGSIAAISQGQPPMEAEPERSDPDADDSADANGARDAARAIEITAQGYRLTLYPNPEKTPEEIHEALQRVLGAILQVDPSA